MWYNTKQEEPINVLECVRLISWKIGKWEMA